MPLTPKEKMQAYRQRLRENKEKAAVLRRRDRERKLLKKMTMTDQQKMIEKEKNRVRVAKHRSKKREQEKNAKRIPGQIQVNNLIAYKTPQTLGKHKTRVLRVLPNSPQKRIELIRTLAEDAGLEHHANKKQRTESTDGEIKSKVQEFYLEESWMCPGVKDTVTVNSPGMPKQTVQKQFMMTTIKEAHEMFKEANPGIKVSYSQFAKWRPQQVYLQSQVPQNSCLCKYHENVRLHLEALKAAGLPVPTTFKEFISLCVCDQEAEGCMTGLCDNCPGLTQLKPDEDLGNKVIQWEQWISEAKFNRTTIRGTVEQCYEELSQKLKHFLKHTYIKRIQAAQFKMEKESVKDDPNKVVIQVDFAENYSTVNQDEIQQAYFGHEQVTLFTVCAWEQKGIHSMVLVSDYLCHDKFAVNVFLDTIFKWLDEEVRTFSEIVLFSDGAASQFKQRYLLCSLTFFNRDIKWSFFATSHGKGAVDGIGGTAKRSVRKEVLSRCVKVNNSLQFTEVAREKCPKIHIIHIAKEEIEVAKSNLNKAFDGISAVPGTLDVHIVTVSGRYRIQVKDHAKSAQSRYHTFKIDANDDAGSSDEDRGDGAVDVADDSGVTIQLHDSETNRHAKPFTMDHQIEARGELNL